MANVLRNPYSNTAGNVPSSLSNGQIGVNQADGKLFYRASNGTVTQFSGGGSSSLAIYASVSAFPATGSESMLYLAEDTSRLYQWEATVYVEVGGSGGGVAHAATHAIGGGDAITITAAQVSNFTTAAAAAAPVVSVAGRTGAVAITSADVSGLGSLATQSSVAYSSLTGVPSSFTPSSHTHTASQVTDFATEAAKYGPVTTVNGQTGAVTVAPVTDGSKGDITVSGNGSTWSIAAGAVTEADLANAVRNSMFHPFLLMGG